VQIQSVDAILTEYCEWWAGRHRESTSRELIRHDFGHFAGMDRVLSRGQVADTASSQDLDTIFREMNEGTHSADMQVPMNALNSFQGSLIKIKHTLQIIVQTKCCVNNPTISIPVQIGKKGDPTCAPASASAASSLPGDAVIPSHFFGDSTTVASTIVVPGTYITVGGPAMEHETEEDVHVAFLDVGTTKLTPSLKNLLKAMKESVADYDLIESKGRDPEWRSVFESLSTSDYEKILNQVDSDFDETRVAVAVAQLVGGKFTCDYVVTALKVASDWNRSHVCEKLLPYCADLKANQGKIQSELSDWEKLVTQVAFENALK
jgi:hypothetical protein